MDSKINDVPNDDLKSSRKIAFWGYDYIKMKGLMGIILGFSPMVKIKLDFSS